MAIEMEIMLRFFIAVIWGAIIGAEREYRGKAAGFRTTILISIGACFFTVMSIWIGGEGNPDRIASNIVTGLGFLCAGVIFRADNHINGITTAATIWAVAAISMAIGAGYYLISACGGGLILLVLTTLTYLQNKIDRIPQLLNLSKVVNNINPISTSLTFGIRNPFMLTNIKDGYFFRLNFFYIRLLSDSLGFSGTHKSYIRLL